VSFKAITLCVASQRVFIVVYFVMDSFRKLLDIPSYMDEVQVKLSLYLSKHHALMTYGTEEVTGPLHRH
jgi:hypothetical protein